jgi:hypothetical protein
MLLECRGSVEACDIGFALALKWREVGGARFISSLCCYKTSFFLVECSNSPTQTSVFMSLRQHEELELGLELFSMYVLYPSENCSSLHRTPVTTAMRPCINNRES